MQIRKQFLFSVGLFWASFAQGEGLPKTSEVPSQELSAPQAEPEKSGYVAAIPLGKTLPERVISLNLTHRSDFGHKGFGPDGTLAESGADYTSQVSMAQIAYGVTKQLSLQVTVPWVHVHRLRLNKYTKARLKAKQEQALKQATKEVAAMFKCDEEKARYLIERGLPLETAKSIPLPTGEKRALAVGERLDHALNDAISESAQVGEPITGLGDIYAGALYNVLSGDDYGVSFGLGMRFPTGDFSKVPHTELNRAHPAFGGVYDGGMRVNLDYLPFTGMWLSSETMLVTALSKGEFHRGSLLNPDQMNLADPTLEGGDGIPNKTVYEKKGVEYASTLKANYGFGALTPMLQAFALNGQYTYSKSRASAIDGHPLDEEGNLHTVGTGVTVSGLGYGLPVECDANYSMPIAGDHRAIATDTMTLSLRLYNRF